MKKNIIMIILTMLITLFLSIFIFYPIMNMMNNNVNSSSDESNLSTLDLQGRDNIRKGKLSKEEKIKETKTIESIEQIKNSLSVDDTVATTTIQETTIPPSTTIVPEATIPLLSNVAETTIADTSIEGDPGLTFAGNPFNDKHQAYLNLINSQMIELGEYHMEINMLLENLDNIDNCIKVREIAIEGGAIAIANIDRITYFQNQDQYGDYAYVDPDLKQVEFMYLNSDVELCKSYLVTFNDYVDQMNQILQYETDIYE